MGLSALSDVDTLELSLVDQGANKKTFALFKSKDGNMDPEILDVINAFLEVEAEGESEFDAVFKADKLGNKEQQTLRAAMRLLSAVKDKVPADIMSKLAKLSGLEAPTKVGDDNYPPPKAVAKAADGDASKVAIAKAMEAIPEEIRKQMEPVFKAQAAALEDSDAKRETLAKALTVERDVRLSREYVAKARTSFAVLGDPEDIGPLLKSLHDFSDEVAAGVEKLLSDANARVEKSELLTVAGERGKTQSGGDAWDRIETAAKEMVTKSADHKMTTAEAIEIVIRKQPELYNEYRAEKDEAR